jgi:glutamine synthetase
MDRQQEFVLRTLEERDIRFVRLWFTDVLGFLKSVAVAPAELEGAFAEGIGFDGSAIEGFARVYESDMVARPDPATFQVLPWEDREGHHYAARMFCDIAMPDGSPSWADPRHVLRRTLAKASESGFTCYVHPEIEFFLLSEVPADGREPTPADNGGYFDQASHETATHFRRHAIETLEAMGISVEFSHHEGAPGQQEIDLRRRADHGRQRDDLPVRGQGSGHHAGRPCLVHAQAVHRPARVGNAYAREPFRGRPERVLRQRRSI